MKDIITWNSEKINKNKEMKDASSLIEKIKNLEQLCLPNGAVGAVWIDDVIEVIENHLNLH